MELVHIHISIIYHAIRDCNKNAKPFDPLFERAKNEEWSAPVDDLGKDSCCARIKKERNTLAARQS
jgi:hypothetical protein